MNLEETLDTYFKDENIIKKDQTYFIPVSEDHIDTIFLTIKGTSLFMVSEIFLKKAIDLMKINDLNFMTTYGNFDYDLKNHKLYYRVSLDVTDRPLSKAQLDHMFYALVNDTKLLKAYL